MFFLSQPAQSPLQISAGHQTENLMLSISSFKPSSVQLDVHFEIFGPSRVKQSIKQGGLQERFRTSSAVCSVGLLMDRNLLNEHQAVLE